MMSQFPELFTLYSQWLLNSILFIKMFPLKSGRVRFASKQAMLLMHFKSCNMCHISLKIKVNLVYGMDNLHAGFNKTGFNKWLGVIDF